jgi:hypothetical protein
VADNTRIEELRRRLEREPASRLFAQLAEELRKEGEHAEAIRVARTGLAAQPNYPSARMTLGRALFDSGDYAGARAEFETVLRGAPDNILASRLLAECLEGVGDLGSALLHYRATQRLVPADKNLEAHIRDLEQTLSAPTVPPPVAVPPPAPAPPRLSHFPPLPPPPPPGTYAPVSPAFAAPPPVPPPPLRPPPPPAAPRVVATAPPATTAEFARPVAVRAAVAEPPLRPPAPPPPLPPPAFVPDPPAPPTLVDESFDLEAPFSVPAPLQSEQVRPLPGRSLPEEPDSEAPTLPVTPAPRFDFINDPAPFMGEPTLVPDAPPPAPVEATPVPPPPPPSAPPIVTALPASPSAPTPTPVPEALDTSWRAPAPPRGRALEETQEIASGGATPPPPPAPPPTLDAIRLEWSSAPDATPSSASPASVEPPPIEPPVPPPAPVAAPSPAPVQAPPPAPSATPVAEASVPLAPSPAPPLSNPAASEPLLSPTLAELYFNQGAMDMARSAYEQLLLREPANERYRARLDEIGRRVSVPAPAAADDGRGARRRMIEGQIARLEELLAAVKRA